MGVHGIEDRYLEGEGGKKGKGEEMQLYLIEMLKKENRLAINSLTLLQIFYSCLFCDNIMFLFTMAL